MKRLLSTIAFLTLTTTISAQTSSMESIDNNNWFEHGTWKTDSVLTNLFQSIEMKYHNDLKATSQLQRVSNNIRDQWNAEINALAKSLGVDPKDAVNSSKPPKDPQAVEKFIELKTPIDSKYGALLRDAEAAAYKDISSQVESAFIAAAKKYYSNSERIQNKQ